MCFAHLGVFLISVKPLTTENTENKTTPKICKITVSRRHTLTDPDNSARSPLREELYNTRIAHGLFLHNFKFHDLCQSSGAVLKIDTSHETLSYTKRFRVQSWWGNTCTLTNATVWQFFSCKFNMLIACSQWWKHHPRLTLSSFFFFFFFILLFAYFLQLVTKATLFKPGLSFTTEK